ncbi:ferric-chelate reductase Frp1 [Basidiobolus ranarum]|uniref:ferric-chelate reductase (NADPH) n=1 Tax=Basidiobolus ranarum TaxID=34480 RepID=A0ABR2VXC6_9FUNG
MGQWLMVLLYFSLVAWYSLRVVFSRLSRNVDIALSAGYISIANIPILTALANKNTILTKLLGISHESLNYLHQASGIATAFTATVHTVLFSLVWLKFGNFQRFILLPFVIYGVIALILFIVLCLSSINYVRRKFYESFLVIHIVAFALAVVFTALHFSEDRVYLFYVFSGFLLFLLDRAIRTFRAIYYNVVLWIRCYRSEDKAQLDTVQLMPGNTLRLEFFKPMKWLPGQHVFISMSDVAFGQWHPFTITSIYESIEDSTPERPIVLVIQARDGFTKTLYERALADCSFKVNLGILVDGPYGTYHPMHNFETVVLIAGGTGAAFTIPILSDLIRRKNQNDPKLLSTKNVQFVWSIKRRAHITWFVEELRKCTLLSPEGFLNVRIHLTAENTDTKSTGSLKEDVFDETSALRSSITQPKSYSSIQKATLDCSLTDLESEEFSDFQTYPHRPNLSGIIHEATHIASQDIGVSVCGPLGLTKSTRQCISERNSFKTKAGITAGIYLHCESFEW